MDQFRPQRQGVTRSNGGQQQPAAMPATGVAKDAVTGQETYTFNRTFDYKGTSEFMMSFTASSDADLTDVNIIPKITNTTPGTLATGLTVGGTYTWAQFLQIIQRARFGVSHLRLQSDDVKNYAGSLKMGRTGYDGVDNPQVVNLPTYRTNVGNGYSDVVAVQDKPFNVEPWFFLQLSKLLKGTTIYVYFILDSKEVPSMVELGQ